MKRGRIQKRSSSSARAFARRGDNCASLWRFVPAERMTTDVKKDDVVLIVDALCAAEYRT